MSRLLHLVCMVFFVALFIGCTDMSETGTVHAATANSGSECTFRVAIAGVPGRAAVVPVYAAADFYYTFTASDADSGDTVISYPEKSGTASSHSAFMQRDFTLPLGTYSMEIKAWTTASCATLVLAYSDSVVLTADTTALSVSLSEPASGTAGTGSGAISVPVTFPASSAVSSVIATLTALANPGTAVDIQSLDVQSASGDTGLQTVTYEKSDVAAGAYLLDFALTITGSSVVTGDNASYTTHISRLVKVASGVTSVPEDTDGVIALSASAVNTRYALSYANMTDSTDSSVTWWADSAVIPLTFASGQTVTLPSVAAVSRNGYLFYGWYENADFSGSAITGFTATAGTKTVYARWITPDLYVSQTGNDTSGDGLSGSTAFATVTAALTALETLATANARTDYDWTVHISGTVSDVPKIQTLSANSLTISGMTGSSVDSIRSDGTSSALRVTGSGAFDIRVSALSLTNGSNSMGGGLYVNNASATVTIQDVVISGNASTNSSVGGGGVGLYNGLVICDGAVIKGNAAAGNGGGVYVYNGEFRLLSGTIGGTDAASANTATGSGGGVIVAPNGTFTMRGGTIAGNTAVSGGGIYVSGACTMTDGEISGNTATGSGGGIYLAHDFTLKGGTVSGNEAANGGGIVNSSGCTLVIESGSITANTATSNGGGLYNGGTVTLSGGTIGGSGASSANTAGELGGGIYNANTGTVEISGSNAVIGNSSVVPSATSFANKAAAGGGIYNTGTLTLSNGTVCGNTAYLEDSEAIGGGVYNAGICTLSGDGYIGMNYAKTAGGGLFDTATLTMSGGEISSNISAGDGGGIYLLVTSGTVTLSGGSVTGNSCGDTSNGAGICVASGSTVTVTLSGIEVSSNLYAKNGGGIYSAGRLAIGEGTTISYNSATDSGGGVYAASGSVLAISGGTISENSLTEPNANGGGVSVYMASSFEMSGGAISGNSATFAGGGLYLFATSTTVSYTMSGGSITENTTGDKAAGVYIGAPFSMSGSAVVATNNDVYLPNTSRTLTVSGALTGTAPVATITPSSYTEGIQVLSGDYATDDNYKKIILTPKNDSVMYIANTGRIQKDTSFVLTSGGTFNSSTTLCASDSNKASSIFIAGRSLTIPKLIASDHEVTQSEYETYCKYAGSSPSSSSGKGDNYPAYYTCWYDALVYCNLRSIAEGLMPVYSIDGETDPTKWTGIVGDSTTKYCGPSSINTAWDAAVFDQTANGWRLPTEAEWEYLTRGGNLTDSNQYTYSGSDTASDVAWYNDGSISHPQEVKQKEANALGLYDMSGNVWEYCWDWAGTITTSSGITGPESTDATIFTRDSGETVKKRVVRGGGYNYGTAQAAVGNHTVFNPPTDRWINCGFRVVRTAK